jgi:hypothetical protein
VLSFAEARALEQPAIHRRSLQLIQTFHPKFVYPNNSAGARLLCVCARVKSRSVALLGWKLAAERERETRARIHSNTARAEEVCARRTFEMLWRCSTRRAAGTLQPRLREVNLIQPMHYKFTAQCAYVHRNETCLKTWRQKKMASDLPGPICEFRHRFAFALRV